MVGFVNGEHKSFTGIHAAGRLDRAKLDQLLLPAVLTSGDDPEGESVLPEGLGRLLDELLSMHIKIGGLLALQASLEHLRHQVSFSPSGRELDQNLPRPLQHEISGFVYDLRLVREWGCHGIMITLPSNAEKYALSLQSSSRYRSSYNAGCLKLLLCIHHPSFGIFRIP